MKKIYICLVFLVVLTFFGFNSSINVRADLIEENTDLYCMKTYITPIFNEHETSSNNITVSFALPNNLDYSYSYEQSNLVVNSSQKKWEHNIYYFYPTAKWVFIHNN